MIVERISRLIQEIRGRDPQRIRSRLLRFDRDIATVAYHVRKLEGSVKDVARSCASSSSDVKKLDSAFDDLSARVTSLSHSIAAVMADQAEHGAVLESLQRRTQSMMDTSQLDRRVKALEEGLAEVVSLLELPPGDLLSVAFRKRPRK